MWSLKRPSKPDFLNNIEKGGGQILVIGWTLIHALFSLFS
jgi:hypothetical protein